MVFVQGSYGEVEGEILGFLPLSITRKTLGLGVKSEDQGDGSLFAIVSYQDIETNILDYSLSEDTTELKVGAFLDVNQYVNLTVVMTLTPKFGSDIDLDYKLTSKSLIGVGLEAEAEALLLKLTFKHNF